ncbi:hypothetical protein SUDANB25_01623 [Streptomyces sp. SudanB25_2051]
MLATYTCVRGASSRSRAIAASNDARNSATGVISPACGRQASFAPIITVTSPGLCRAASAICPGSSSTRAPDLARFQLRDASAGAPTSRSARLFTAGSEPVAHDTSGQSVSSPQASKPRVMESPTAATDAGRGFHSGVGEGLGRAGAASRRSASAPLLLSGDPTHPDRAAPQTSASAPASAAARRTARRTGGTGGGGAQAPPSRVKASCRRATGPTVRHPKRPGAR